MEKHSEKRVRVGFRLQIIGLFVLYVPASSAVAVYACGGPNSEFVREKVSQRMLAVVLEELRQLIINIFK